MLNLYFLMFQVIYWCHFISNFSLITIQIGYLAFVGAFLRVFMEFLVFLLSFVKFKLLM